MNGSSTLATDTEEKRVPRSPYAVCNKSLKTPGVGSAWLPSRFDMRFLALEKARDDVALELGQRWYQYSGAAQKKDVARHTYEEYSSFSVAKKEANQIEKDVLRLGLVSYGKTPKGLYEFFERAVIYSPDGKSKASSPSGKEDRLAFDVHTELRRVLRAFVARNPSLGYTQGMNYVVCMLLGLMNEEDAFWTFCCLVEELRPKNYYDHSLSGFLCDRSLIRDVVLDVFETVPKKLLLELERLYASLLLPMFYPKLTLKSLLVLWDAYFAVAGHPKSKPHALRKGAGEAALFAILLYIVEKGLDAVNATYETEEEMDACRIASPTNKGEHQFEGEVLMAIVQELTPEEALV
mmetsp:Transcript_18804/g.35490  ORF Transcript_18804/g.35490 Transcript_18804/m.35490 type:complete len:350 (-) Transcript_18804:396-1445(-)|eukprot:CAMPEP_0170190804 /NCGR_PEP_ID=MMETSP0040_2-20121228/50173_1 /TAXON_ID=641309 /ORGANISM="Lotharella oceanica, Strain CCMP622" /LENGTH=349 /DNA_ID=CAMNT_0010438743 /DNA_START=8 /DNA_END=1057 /DNA_ORIENTATION=-